MNHTPPDEKDNDEDGGPLCIWCDDQGWIMDMDMQEPCPHCNPTPHPARTLPRWLYRPLCWLIGHRWNAAADEHYEWLCERCHFNQAHTPTPNYGEPWTLGAWLWWRWRLFKQWRNDQKLRRFFQKHRADHLDYPDDDIPF
jgi:hypothetical protein